MMTWDESVRRMEREHLIEQLRKTLVQVEVLEDSLALSGWGMRALAAWMRLTKWQLRHALGTLEGKGAAR